LRPLLLASLCAVGHTHWRARPTVSKQLENHQPTTTTTRGLRTVDLDAAQSSRRTQSASQAGQRVCDCRTRMRQAFSIAGRHSTAGRIPATPILTQFPLAAPRGRNRLTDEIWTSSRGSHQLKTFTLTSSGRSAHVGRLRLPSSQSTNSRELSDNDGSLYPSETQLKLCFDGSAGVRGSVGDDVKRVMWFQRRRRRLRLSSGSSGLSGQLLLLLLLLRDVRGIVL
jgi:hypothetical protein